MGGRAIAGVGSGGSSIAEPSSPMTECADPVRTLECGREEMSRMEVVVERIGHRRDTRLGACLSAVLVAAAAIAARAQEPAQEPTPAQQSAPVQEPASAAQDPHAAVYSADLFPSAKECATCHQTIFDEWRYSNHAYASISPMFNKFEQRINDLAAGTIGYFCLRCHATVGTTLGERRDLPLWERSSVSR